MKVLYYARPAENGFDRRPADVVRVEIVQLYHPTLNKNIFQWRAGEWVLEDITKSEIAIENIYHAADVLATEQGWTLLTEIE